MTFPLSILITWVRNLRDSRRKECHALDDTQIIALFLARDENAIHETDLAYGRRLRTLANRILPPGPDCAGLF